MEEVSVNKSDELVMKLLHYFMTKEGYNPIVLQGAKNEIWLENVDNGSYGIVRIVTDYIHNDEQFQFDVFKTKKIAKKIKRKMMSFKMNVLCLYLNLGDNVEVLKDEEKIGNLKCLKINNIDDINKYTDIINVFPTITDNTNFDEKGIELFMKLTKDINSKNETDAKKAEDVFKMRKPVVTYALIFINVFMFALMYILGNGSNDVDTLLYFGANYRPFVLGGEIWRLLTSAFLHIGFLHLILNMYALYVIGPQLESFYGKFKYLVIYLFSAISGSLLSIIFSSYVSAGASGAIFGLLGSLLYFGYHYRIYLGNVMKSQIIPIILLNLFISLLPGIDGAAHVGGLIAGVFASMAVGVKYKSTTFDRINGWVVSTIFMGFLIFMAFFN